MYPPHTSASRCFNPRPREGGDVRTVRCRVRWKLFQSTPPRRGRHSFHRCRNYHSAGFNPRPREGGADCPPSESSAYPHVSIHAPAKGATSSVSSMTLVRSLFQSTPPRRGRQSSSDMAAMKQQFQSTPPRRGRRHIPQRYDLAGICFNPRPREGGDQLSTNMSTGRTSVSIHAPAKGAT